MSFHDNAMVNINSEVPLPKEKHAPRKPVQRLLFSNISTTCGFIGLYPLGKPKHEINTKTQEQLRTVISTTKIKP